jgi:enterochelin esterase family protein
MKNQRVSLPLARRLILAIAWIATSAVSGLVFAQESPAFNSHEVHGDGSVTFRYKDLSAQKVLLHLDGRREPFEMQKDAAGIWSVLIPPLAPQIYGYVFEADGRYGLDPANPFANPNLFYLSNPVTVPGAVPQPWEVRDVPHGTVHHHFFTSKVAAGLVKGQSEYYVYTPPNYDPKRHQPYPTLYLLHGWSDMANGWTDVGKANFILDALIAEGKAKPMLVVMPLGYGDMKFVNGGEGQWDSDAAVEHNSALFSQTLLTEVLPQVEAAYRVSKKRDGRAIAGLSMGGLESLSIGLAHPEQFAWVGGFSAALGHREMEQLSAFDAKKAALRLVWIACGTEDGLITPSRKFVEWLKSKDVAVTAIETPGMHTWMVWRDNLVNFAPLLFQGK